MVDLSSLKIELKAKNSSPIAPSDTNGGNISHRDKKQNDLVDFLQTEIVNLSSRIAALESSSGSDDSSGSDGSETTSTYEWTGDLAIEKEVIIFTSTEDINIETFMVSGISDIDSLEFFTPDFNFLVDDYFTEGETTEMILNPAVTVAAGTNIFAYTEGATETGVTIKIITV